MRLPEPLPPQLAGLVSHEREIGGQRVCWTQAGSGPPLLLLHGAVLVGNAFFWELQVALAPWFTTYAPDFPGWGDSAKPPGTYPMERYHDFIDAFLAALGLEKPAVLGHSMGGLLASSHAVLRPNAFSRLVVLAAPAVWLDLPRLPGPFRPFASPRAGRLLLGLASRLGPGSIFGVRRSYERLFHRPRGPAAARVVPLLRASAHVLREKAHRRAFTSTMAEHVRRARSGEFAPLGEAATCLGIPILFLAGADDPLFPLARIRAAAARCPGALLEVIPACGHFPTWEQPDAVVSSLRRFLG